MAGHNIRTQCGNVQYSTVRNSTVQYGTVQYKTVIGEEDGMEMRLGNSSLPLEDFTALIYV